MRLNIKQLISLKAHEVAKKHVGTSSRIKFALFCIEVDT